MLMCQCLAYYMLSTVKCAGLQVILVLAHDMLIQSSDMLSTCIQIIWTPFNWRWNIILFMDSFIGEMGYVFF